MTKRRPGGTELTAEEIGFICEGFVFATRPMRVAIKEVTSRYSLGPRGAWLLLLISNGNRYPLDLANMFRIGRSLITAELAQLTEAGLVTSRRSKLDGRRMELTLTQPGIDACASVRGSLSDLVNERLHAYSRDELLLCARILHDLHSAEDEPGLGWLGKQAPEASD